MGAVDDAARRLLDDMLETMYAAPGIGLAAPQVGVLKRLVVIDCARDEEEPDPLKLVDPEIVWRSDELVIGMKAACPCPKSMWMSSVRRRCASLSRRERRASGA